MHPEPVDVWLDVAPRFGRTVLRELVRAAVASGRYQVQQEDRVLFEAVSSLFYPSSRQRGLEGRAWVPDEAKRVVALEVRGSGLEETPTGAAHAALVEEFFRPLVASVAPGAALANGRLYTGRRALPPLAAKRFKQFLFASRREDFEPSWPLFYDFVLHCHGRRVALDDEELRHFLGAAGVPDPTAGELASLYLHCRRLLARRS